MSDAGAGADARRVYDRIADKVPWPDQQVNRVVLVFLVLPMAALYTGLRDRGRTEQQAVEAVTRAVGGVLVGPERRVMGLLVRTDGGRRLLLRGEAITVDLLLQLGGPAWDATVVERSENRLAIDVTCCYIRDTLRRLDAAPAVLGVCAHDVSAFTSLCRQLRLTRTGTLGSGADRCDFRLELLPPGVGPKVAP